jgi:hypothetical protein
MKSITFKLAHCFSVGIFIASASLAFRLYGVNCAFPKDIPNATYGNCPSCIFYTHYPEVRDCSGPGTIFDCAIVPQTGHMTYNKGVCYLTPLGQYICANYVTINYYGVSYNGAIASVHTNLPSCYY